MNIQQENQQNEHKDRGESANVQEALKSGKEALNKANKNAKKVQKVIKAVMAVIKFLLTFWKAILIAIIIVTILGIIGDILDLFDGSDGDEETAYSGEQFSDVSANGGIIQGNTIQEKVWLALRGLGYSEYAVAGAMGNIHKESVTFNSQMVEYGYNENNGGIGLCQWTNNERGATGRNSQLKAYAASKGVTWKDEDTQVEFLVAELTVGGTDFADYQFMDKRDYYNSPLATANGWKNAKNVEDATEAFCYSFERPNKDDAIKSMDERKGYARDYYKQFAGKTNASNEKWLNGSVPLNGKTFYIYNQNLDNSYETDLGLKDWKYFCGRASSICIISGYAVPNNKTAFELMKEVDGYAEGTPKESWFEKYGLTMKKIKSKNTGNYDYKSDLRSILTSGNHALIYVRGKNHYKVDYGGNNEENMGITGKGKSTKVWTDTFHWMAILAYRNNNGKEEMYIANSTGTPSGWYGLDEFLVDGGKEVKNLFSISPNK